MRRAALGAVGSVLVACASVIVGCAGGGGSGKAGQAQGQGKSSALPLTTGEGKPYSIAAERGQVVLLDFWATWCEPCKATLPNAQRLADRLGGKGLRVYAVNIEADAALARPFLDSLHVTLPILHDPSGRAAEELGGSNLPFLVLFDRGGTIRFRQEGAPEGLEEKVAAEVEKLLAEPLP